jgi:acyl-CoA thioesterase I
VSGAGLRRGRRRHAAAMLRTLCLLVLTIGLAQAADRASGKAPAKAVLPVALFRNLQAGKAQTVVAYGTSLTAAGPWVGMLKPWFDARYPRLVTVLNAGNSGVNSGWGLAHVKANVVAKNPDLVFVEFGINDAHVKFTLTPEKARANLDGIIAAIRAGNPKADIVLQTMNVAVDVNGKTAGTDRPLLDAFYGNYTACAAQEKLPLLDHHPQWKKLAADDLKTFLAYAPDGLHPNKDGLLAITWPNIEKLLLASEAAAKR